MEMSCLKFQRRDDGVGLLWLSRPQKLNALNAQLIGELDVLLAELDAGEPLRALIVTGEGGRAFAAGADIAEMAEYSVEQATEMARRGQRALARLESFHAPTIAAVHGFALGGGCELAMCCDLILASATAVFGQPEVKLGVIPGFGGTQRLPRRVGAQRALELTLTGRNVSAEEAARIGLVLEVVPEDVVEAAVALALRIGANGPLAVRAAREAWRSADHDALWRGLDGEAERFGRCFATADQREGMAAYLGRRAPGFVGA